MRPVCRNVVPAGLQVCPCRPVDLSTCCYEAQRLENDAHLSGRITELSLERRRSSYRRIWQLLVVKAFMLITSVCSAFII